MHETIGKLSSDLKLKAQDNTHSAHEQMQESLTDYEESIIECLRQAKLKYPSGDFFLVVITKKERLLDNVLRNYYFSRRTCPTPDYDQAVYHYHRQGEKLEFLWVIPSKDTCIDLKQNALQIAPEERDLLRFVLDFSDGLLYKKAKQLNGEELASPLLVKG